MTTKQTNDGGLLDKLKSNYYIILIVFIALGFVQNCSTQSKVSKLQNINIQLVYKMDSLTNITVTKEHLDKQLKENLYKSLILEEDIDKGVISISQIKKEQLKDEQ